MSCFFFYSLCGTQFHQLTVKGLFYRILTPCIHMGHFFYLVDEDTFFCLILCANIETIIKAAIMLTEHSRMVQQLVCYDSCFSCSVLSCCPLVFLSTICYIHLFLLISGLISRSLEKYSSTITSPPPKLAHHLWKQNHPFSPLS